MLQLNKLGFLFILGLCGRGQAWAPRALMPGRAARVVILQGQAMPSKRIGQKGRKGGFGSSVFKAEVVPQGLTFVFKSNWACARKTSCRGSLCRFEIGGEKQTATSCHDQIA